MDTTLFLGQFWGWLFLVTAIVYLMKGESDFKELLKMHKDVGFVFLTGWLSLVLGLATLLLHDGWRSDWTAVICIIGWLSLFKGITRIGFPQITLKLLNAYFKNNIMVFRVSLIFVGLFGIWLIYMSS